MSNTGIEHPQIYGDWKIGTLPLRDFIGHSENIYLQNNKSGIKEFYNHVSKATYENTFDRDVIVVGSTRDNAIDSQNEVN